MTQNPFLKESRKFSIIIPCYKDDAHYLSRVFEAIENNDYTNYEVIVVFDGKNILGSRNINKYQKEHNKFPVTHFTIEHGGAPKARNFGATKATGDYYVFLDSDSYLYPETLRMWANVFEEYPKVNRVWGIYDILTPNGAQPIGGSVPVDPTGKPYYWSFQFSNYCDSSFPIRKEAYVGWDESVKSLQDWDMNIRMLKQNDYKGEDWFYIPRHSFYAKEPTHVGGLSDDSHQNWIERVSYVKEKNGIKKNDICVTSQGAPHHGINVAKMLGGDYLPMPSFKPHTYKMIYMLGFYTDDSQYPVTQSHMESFKNSKGINVIHWIGTDVLQIHWKCSWQKIKSIKYWMNENKIINLTEFEQTQKELEEIGIASDIVPIPPQKLYEPMPLPKEFTVGIYESAQQNMYGEELMQEVARSMPDVKFVFFGNDNRKNEKTANTVHMGYTSLEDLMPSLSCNLRISVHDGLPLTPLEFLMAGRSVVSNTKLKGAIYAGKDRKEVVEAIRLAQRTPIDPKISKIWRTALDQEKYRWTIWGLL